MSELQRAITRRNAAEQFSDEWFAAKAGVERLFDQEAAAEFAERQKAIKVTDEQMDLMDHVLSDDYDD